MKRRSIPLAVALSLCIIFLIGCSDNPIWDRFAKNPNVKLGVDRGDVYVDFTNELVRINSGPTMFYGSGRITGQTYTIIENGVTITRVFKNIKYDGVDRITSYNEGRTYSPGGNYSIRIYGIQYDALGSPLSFYAEIDGFEYSFP